MVDFKFSVFLSVFGGFDCFVSVFCGSSFSGFRGVERLGKTRG